jgi:hypothetical protein
VGGRRDQLGGSGVCVAGATLRVLPRLRPAPRSSILSSKAGRARRRTSRRALGKAGGRMDQPAGAKIR